MQSSSVRPPAASRSSHSVKAAVLLMVAFFLAFSILVGVQLYRTHQDTERNLSARAESAARIVAANAGWIVEVAQQTLRRVDLTIGDNLLVANGDTVLDLREEMGGLPLGADIYIVGADGETLYSTVPGASTVSITDREYFQAPRDGALFYTSALLTSRLTGEPIFVFSRRMERDGEFAGVAIISFNPQTLAEFWALMDLDPGSSISLVRKDGALIGRFPARPVDEEGFTLPLPSHLETETQGGFRVISPVDGIARLVSFRAVPETDIIALASFSVDEAWRDYWRQLLIFALLAVPVLGGLALASIITVRTLQRDAKRRQELEKAVETNTMLFREIHHRVKNNLQTAQSLVRLQEIPQLAKLDLQSRFAAMAAMHEHIYEHDEYIDIIATDYVPAIVAPTLATYGSGAKVNYDIDPIPIDRDHATPLALLLSELVTNALKYAFKDKTGTITVSLKPAEKGRSVLTVADDGDGFDAGPGEQSMGMRLIEGIVAQLDGNYRYIKGNGTRFEAELALSRTARATVGAPSSM